MIYRYFSTKALMVCEASCHVVHGIRYWCTLILRLQYLLYIHTYMYLLLATYLFSLPHKGNKNTTRYTCPSSRHLPLLPSFERSRATFASQMLLDWLRTISKN